MKSGPILSRGFLSSDLPLVCLTLLFLTTEFTLNTAQADDASIARGQAFYQQTCVACHGDQAQGNRPLNSPALHQQEPWYINAQLQKFRMGLRGADPADVTGLLMAPMAKALPNDQAVRDVTDYITSLDGPPATHELTGGDIAAGQQLYGTVCVACHGADGGGLEALKAPALAGQSDWYMVAQMKKFKSAVRGGNSEDISGAQMQAMAATIPDEAAMNNLATYIASLPPVEYKEAIAAEDLPPADPEQVARGADFFQGVNRFENGGPACNSCHDVQNDAVIGGGILAIELTEVFGRLGGAGVRAILGAPPFPVMQAAYKGQSLTEDEVASLVGFLQQADRDKLLHQPRDYGFKLFGAGVVGVILLLILHSLLWNRRRRVSVNQSIFDRQINASN